MHPFPFPITCSATRVPSRSSTKSAPVVTTVRAIRARHAFLTSVMRTACGPSTETCPQRSTAIQPCLVWAEGGAPVPFRDPPTPFWVFLVVRDWDSIDGKGDTDGMPPNNPCHDRSSASTPNQELFSSQRIRVPVSVSRAACGAAGIDGGQRIHLLRFHGPQDDVSAADFRAPGC